MMISKLRDVRIDLCLVGAIGAVFMLPAIAAADPNAKSVAQIEACEETASTARVCSSKELSNIVLQCGNAETSYYFKFDDLDNPENWPEGQLTATQGSFTCPDGDSLLAVFVKSGSQKNDGEILAGLPGAGGAIWSPLACSTESDCESSSEAIEE
ncbi:MAG TPA: hypothetical protein VGA68_02855 [Woeseiaceae bacterium]